MDESRVTARSCVVIFIRSWRDETTTLVISKKTQKCDGRRRADKTSSSGAHFIMLTSDRNISIPERDEKITHLRRKGFFPLHLRNNSSHNSELPSQFPVISLSHSEEGSAHQ